MEINRTDRGQKVTKSPFGHNGHFFAESHGKKGTDHTVTVTVTHTHTAAPTPAFAWPQALFSLVSSGSLVSCICHGIFVQIM